jgi:cellulose synthase/poly-beta-1,6-N-acetylglucosamine synthase-like glycosyltransferase
MFLFTDADSILPPKIIETLTAEITNRELDAGGFTQRMPSKRRGISFGARLMNGYLRLMQHTPWPIAFGSCLFVTKQAFTEMKGFDTTLFIMEDYDLALRARRAGFRVGVVSSPFIGSDRRFIENPSQAWRGLYGEWYRYTHGLRITRPIYDYAMGGKTKKKS